VKFPFAALLLLGVVGCASANRISSITLPGNPTASYHDDTGHGTLTIIASNPYGVESGVDGRVLTLTTFASLPDHALANNVMIDYAGDVGIRGGLTARGSISTVSTRSKKKNIRALTVSAADVLARTAIVTYRYADDARRQRHIGIIADDAPTEIGGPLHDHFDITNAAALNLAALRILDARIAHDEQRIAFLRKAIARKRLALLTQR
jgi:hypothetical protein